MHLVGYLYEAYHDARSLEYKIIVVFDCIYRRTYDPIDTTGMSHLKTMGLVKYLVC